VKVKEDWVIHVLGQQDITGQVDNNNNNNDNKNPGNNNNLYNLCRCWLNIFMWQWSFRKYITTSRPLILLICKTLINISNTSSC